MFLWWLLFCLVHRLLQFNIISLCDVIQCTCLQLVLWHSPTQSFSLRSRLRTLKLSIWHVTLIGLLLITFLLLWLNILTKATWEERDYFGSQFEDTVQQGRENHVSGAWCIGQVGSGIKKNKMINVCVHLASYCLCSPWSNAREWCL